MKTWWIVFFTKYNCYKSDLSTYSSKVLNDQRNLFKDFRLQQGHFNSVLVIGKPMNSSKDLLKSTDQSSRYAHLTHVFLCNNLVLLRSCTIQPNKSDSSNSFKQIRQGNFLKIINYFKNVLIIRRVFYKIIICNKIGID